MHMRGPVDRLSVRRRLHRLRSGRAGVPDGGLAGWSPVLGSHASRAIVFPASFASHGSSGGLRLAAVQLCCRIASAVLVALAVAAASHAGASAVPAVCLPAQLEFPDVPTIPARMSALLTVLIRDHEAAPLVIVGARIIGADAGDFSLPDGAPRGVVDRGAGYALCVRFSPRAGGERRATLRLELCAASATYLEVPLRGTGSLTARVGAPRPPTHAFAVGNIATPGAPSAAGGLALPVTIRWSTGEGASPTAYELQECVEGGPYRDVVLESALSTRAIRRLTVGAGREQRVYSYRVRALRDGRASEWVMGAPFSLVPLALDGQFVQRSGGWTPNASSPGGGIDAFSVLAGRGRMKVSARVGSEAVAGIAWITRVGPDRGIAVFSVDRGAPVSTDLYAPRECASLVAGVATDLGREDSHTLTIQALGTHRPASSGTRVEVNGVVVMADGVEQAGDAHPSAMLALLGCAAGLTSNTSQGGEHPASYEIHDDYTSLDGGGEPGTGQPGAEDAHTSPPLALAFSSITPNPCAAQSRVTFTTPHNGWVQLSVVDVSGRFVQALAVDVLPAGPHSAVWDGRDAHGGPVNPGVYFAVLRFEDSSRLARLVRF